MGACHGTTILSVRKNGQVVIGGDGQVSLQSTILKSSARKVRRLAGGKIIAGFAGSTADALTLLERLETKLERHPGQLTRAAVELAKAADPDVFRADFVAHAKAWAETEGVPASAFRNMGVPGVIVRQRSA